MKRLAIIFALALICCLVASAIWSVPYVVTVAWLLVFACVGHFVTLDDDLSGGWSNPDGEKSIYRWSLFELGIKVVFAAAVWVLIYRFPGLKEFGS